MYIKSCHSNIIYSKDEKQLYCLHPSGLSIRDSQTLKILYMDNAIKHPNYCELDMDRDRLFIHNTTGKIGLFNIKECQYTHFYQSEKDDGCKNIIIHNGCHLLDVSWSGILSYFNVENEERTILYVFDNKTEMPNGIFTYDKEIYAIVVSGKFNHPIKMAIFSEPIEKNNIKINILNNKISIGTFCDYSYINKLFTFSSFRNIVISTIMDIKSIIPTDEYLTGSIWSKDGKYIIAFGKSNIYIIDYKIIKIIKHIQVKKIIYRIMFSHDGKYMFIHDWNGSEILLWEEFLADCLKAGNFEE